MTYSRLNRARKIAWVVVGALALGSCGGTTRTIQEPVTSRPVGHRSVLVAIEQQSGRPATLRFLEERTLHPVRSEPVGHLELAIRSQDGSKVATASAREPYRSGNTPHTFRVFDLQSQMPLLEVEHVLSPWHAVFAEDGMSVYWLVPAGQAGPGMSIHRLDVKTARFAEPIVLPQNLFVRAAEALPGGGLAMFGSLDDYQGGAFRTSSVGQVYTVSADGRVGGLTLPDIQLIGSDADAKGMPPGREGFEPGLAWDLGRRLLHVVHADSEKVTTVTLDNLGVQQGEIVRKRSIASALLSWLIPSATAKELIPFTNRTAILAPGGETMFVSGRRMKVEQRSETVWRQTSDPLGLSVVRTSDMAKVQTLEGDVVSASVSPEGKYLLTQEGGWVMDTDNTNREIAPNRMRILAADDLSLVSELRSEFGQFNGFSSDGRTVYLSGCASGVEEGPGVLTAVDVETGGAIAQSPLAQCYVNLL